MEETIDLPDDTTENIAEETALSHESDYDDELGVPESLDITVNENGEPVAIQEECEDTCDKSEY